MEKPRPDMKSGRGYVKQDLLFGKSHLAWRWRWDLNPRWSYPHTRFRGVLLRPLGHATADEGTREPSSRRNQVRRGPGAFSVRRRRLAAARRIPPPGPRRPPRVGG